MEREGKKKLLLRWSIYLLSSEKRFGRDKPIPRLKILIYDADDDEDDDNVDKFKVQQVRAEDIISVRNKIS